MKARLFLPSLKSLYFKRRVQSYIAATAEEVNYARRCLLLRTFPTQSTFLTSLGQQETLPYDVQAEKATNSGQRYEFLKFFVRSDSLKCQPSPPPNPQGARERETSEFQAL